MAIFGEFFFCILCFQRARVQQVSDLHLKFALYIGHTMCGSMADIQSVAAEIRRGKKEERTNYSRKIYMVCPIP